MDTRIDRAYEAFEIWLRDQPSWHAGGRDTPLISRSGGVVSHHGPVILSEHDCVLHFARFLNQESVEWHDMHLEFTPGKWFLDSADEAARPSRIDLAIARLSELKKLSEPVDPEDPKKFRLDAVFEFKLASDYWLRSAKRANPKPPKRVADGIQADVDKAAGYLETGLSKRAYVVVVEECDHGADRWAELRNDRKVEPRVRFVECWRR